MLRRLRIENLVLIREAVLDFGPGLNAITGETGAGKTILAQAIGLLLGARADASHVAPGAGEAYVEAELALPDGVLEEEGFHTLAELRPEDEEGVVLARRITSDGRTRALAWGRSAPSDDVAALAERLIAMSGQFEQRRLARPSYQLEVLDTFAGEEQVRLRTDARRAWRELQVARRRREEAVGSAGAARERLVELGRIVEATEGMEPGAEDELRSERERLRHVDQLALGVAAAAEALAPEDGEGAVARVAAAERVLVPLEALAPELRDVGDELRDSALRLRENASELRRFLASLDADPGRLEYVEAEVDRIAAAKRRFGCASYDELLARADEAKAELAASDGSLDAVAAAEAALADAEKRVQRLHEALRSARREAAPRFAAAVAAELSALGMSDAEFVVEVADSEPSPSGVDEARFLVRANAGLPLAPVAQTASGGELSRIALAIAAVAGGHTLVFDEIDAGIGGRTAHAVGGALARLGERAQVVTITHLPQIASRAERHFRVEKVPGEPTYATIEALDDDERRSEIERMLGGKEFLGALAVGVDG